MTMSPENHVVAVVIQMERKSAVVVVDIAVWDTKWILVVSVSTILVAVIIVVLVVLIAVWIVVVTSSEPFLTVLLKQTLYMRVLVIELSTSLIPMLPLR